MVQQCWGYGRAFTFDMDVQLYLKLNWGKMEPSKNQEDKWYFKTSALIIAILCVGPLALPLVWFNKNFKISIKILITVTVLILTYYLTILTLSSLKEIMKYYQMLY